MHAMQQSLATLMAARGARDDYSDWLVNLHGGGLCFELDKVNLLFRSVFLCFVIFVFIACSSEVPLFDCWFDVVFAACLHL